MRHLLLTFLIFLVIPFSAFSSEADRALYLKGPSTINFGTLREGEIVKESLRFQNKGTYPVKIIKIEAGCTCIIPRYKNDVLKPGEELTIPVEFHTNGFSGPQKRLFTVFSTDVIAKELPITFNGIVQRAVNFEPQALDFTMVKEGQPLQLPLTISTPDNNSKVILRSLSDRVDVTTVSEDKNVHRYLVTLDSADLPPGEFRSLLSLTVKQENVFRYSIPVFTFSDPPFMFSPSMVTFGVFTDESRGRREQIVQVKASELEVTSVSSEHPALSVEKGDSTGEYRLILDVDRLTRPRLRTEVLFEFSNGEVGHLNVTGFHQGLKAKRKN